MADDVLKQLQDEAAYFKVNEAGKIECILNHHAFPPRLDIIKAFISGKKYQTLKKRKNVEVSLDKYEPFLTQSINFPSMLFCSLTNQLIDKSLDRIKQHMQGRRFLNAKERYMKDEMELWEEPNLDDEVLEEEEEEEEEEEGDTSLNSQGDQPESNHSVENDRERVRMEKVHLKRGAELKTGIKHKKQKQT